MVINFNNILNVSANRSAVDRDDQTQSRVDKSHASNIRLEATGQSPETNLAELDDSFKKLSDVRYEKVEQARERLNGGHYDERQTAIDLAKTILDIF